MVPDSFRSAGFLIRKEILTMTQMKQARLSAAIATVMGGAALAVPLASMAVDVNSPWGFSPTHSGQAVIVPYYTTRYGWRTTIGMTNTTDSALLVKARFREAMNSRDVLDFSIMLSPHDMWVAVLRPNEGTGGVELVIPDGERSCTSPVVLGGGSRNANGQDIVQLSAEAYTGSNADGGATELGRLREGYIEFFVAGECRQGEPCMTSSAPSNNNLEPRPGIGWLVTHEEKADGTWQPRDCAAASNMGRANSRFPGTSRLTTFLENANGFSSGVPGNLAMRAGSPLWLGPADPVTGAAEGAGWGGVRHPAPLRGFVQYSNLTQGLGGGVDVLHLDAVACTGRYSNNHMGTDTARTAQDLVADCDWVGTQQNNLLASAQDLDFFLEPTLATMPMGLWDARGLGAVEYRFTWARTLSEWTNNDTTQTYTDWVINFPTKAFHVDRSTPDVVQANFNRWRVDGSGYVANGETAPLAPFDNLWGEYPSFVNPVLDSTFGAPVRFELAFWDREERRVLGETVVSPGPNVPALLPYETNVISFRPDGMVGVLGSTIGQYYDLLGQLRAGNTTGSTRGGWARLDFANRDMGAVPFFVGLPVYGVNFTTQQVSEMNAPFPSGFVTMHGYEYLRQ